jgi:NAD(P)-dependent dehydrogenase (short-subunit alcohol dehydrogenase family)
MSSEKECGNPYEGKVAVITGGSRGMGAHLAQSLRAHGCKVVVLAREPKDEDGDIVIACDVSDESQQHQAFEHIAREVDRLDYAFINAGVSGFTPLLEMSSEEWDRVLDINLRGAFVTLREVGNLMKVYIEGEGKQDRGSIITCCSLSSFAAENNIGHYNAAKAGLAMLTKTAARELGQYGIRVNGVAPGLTKTDIIAGTEAIPNYQERVAARTPLGRLGESEDITQALMALFPLDWVTGEIIKVDGGLSLFTATDPLES